MLLILLYGPWQETVLASSLDLVISTILTIALVNFFAHKTLFFAFKGKISSCCFIIMVYQN